MAKKFIVLFCKIIMLFVSGLYLIGFVWFPLLGVGNYQLVKVDTLLPSEWVFLTVIGIIEVLWSVRLTVKFYITINHTFILTESLTVQAVTQPHDRKQKN